jgi:hypothetical protein
MFTAKDISRYERYLPKEQHPNQCWNWTGSLATGGYGYFGAVNLITKKRVQIGAHRFTALIKYQIIPDSIFAMHTCDNPSCCNPNHIELGDCKQNTKDAIARGLLVTAKGEKHGRSKLSEKQAKQIIAMLHTTTIKDISQQFSMSERAIQDIKYGVRWKHLPR